MTSLIYRGYSIDKQDDQWRGQRGPNYAAAESLDELKAMIDDGEAVCAAWADALDLRPYQREMVEALARGPVGVDLTRRGIGTSQTLDEALRKYADLDIQAYLEAERKLQAPEPKWPPLARTAFVGGAVVLSWLLAFGIYKLLMLVS